MRSRCEGAVVGSSARCRVVARDEDVGQHGWGKVCSRSGARGWPEVMGATCCLPDREMQKPPFWGTSDDRPALRISGPVGHTHNTCDFDHTTDSDSPVQCMIISTNSVGVD